MEPVVQANGPDFHAGSFRHHHAVSRPCSHLGARFLPLPQHRPLPDDPVGHHLCEGSARVFGIPHNPTRRYSAPTRPKHRLNPFDPSRRLRGPCHRGLRKCSDPRQLPSRRGGFHHSRHYQFHRHHQGRWPYRGGRRAFHLGRHAGQTNGDRRRTQRRHHR